MVLIHLLDTSRGVADDTLSTSAGTSRNFHRWTTSFPPPRCVPGTDLRPHRHRRGFRHPNYTPSLRFPQVPWAEGRGCQAATAL